MVVDTFKLPSACVCNYRGEFGLSFRLAFDGEREPPKCSAEDATSSLDELEVAPVTPVENNLVTTYYHDYYIFS
jgi:hypothetical protein